MTTEAQEVTTVDELQLRFVCTLRGDGTPDDHWSTGGDDRG